MPMIEDTAYRKMEFIGATRNVVLTAHQEQVIHDFDQSGRYQNASEVMREGLRLLEQRVAQDTAKIEAMRQLTLWAYFRFFELKIFS